MNQKPPIQTPEQKVKFLQILWMAMLASSVVYLLIGWMQASSLPETGRSVLANLVWLFGAFFVGLGYVLPKMLFKNSQTHMGEYTQALIIRYAMFESLAVLSLVNFISQGVSFLEMAAGIVVAFTLILINKPKLIRA